MQNAVERLNELKKDFGTFAKISSDVIGAFGQMRGACCREGGALDFKTIELISVAVAVSRKCEPCILSHLEICVNLDITIRIAPVNKALRKWVILHCFRKSSILVEAQITAFDAFVYFKIPQLTAFFTTGKFWKIPK